MSFFDEYKEDFLKHVHSVDEQLTKAENYAESSEEKERLLHDTETELKQATTLLEQMKLQTFQMSTSKKKNARSRTKEFSRTLKAARKRRARIHRAYLESELENGNSNLSREAQNQSMRRGVDTLRDAYDCLGGAEENAEIAIGELGRQDDVLHSAQSKAKSTGLGISNAGQLLNRMQNREFRHRCYIAGMIAAGVFTVLLTLVICLSSSSSNSDT